MTSHIVCRDCCFEAITGDRFAEDTVETHETATGHEVASERVDDGTRLVTDGGRPHAFPSDDIWAGFRESDIGIGDVVVDLSRGVSLQVTSVATERAGEHPKVRSDQTAEMFGADAEDLVFNCVFLPDGEGAITPPTKTYAYPESRLLRFPIEQATGNQRLQRKWLTNVLEELAVVATKFNDRREREGLFRAIDEAFGTEVADLAKEFADAAGGESA